MKLHLPLLSAAAALLLGTTASADVTIRITGSTAFRASSHNAIKNMMTGVTYAYAGSSLGGASTAIFKGSLSGVNGVTTVKTSWSGAVAGVKALVLGSNVNFLLDSTTVSSGGTSGATTTGDNSPADFAMVDNLQASTPYTTLTLDATRVGVIPFAFVASRSAPSGLTNITPQLAQSLWSTGFSSAALFTNNAADASDLAGGTMVYAMGRDPLSGTRLVSFAESGVGTGAVVTQYRRTAVDATASPNQAITTIDLTAADAAVNAPQPGNNGESSGGNLADNLRFVSTSVNDSANAKTGVKACFIAYLGESDANRAVNGTGSSVNGTASVGCRYLSYNGVSAFGGVVVSTSTASTTNGSPVVTGLTTTGLVAGQLVRSSTGQIPGDSVILSVDSGTQVTLSKNATATASGTVNFATSNLLPQAIWNGSYTMWGYEYLMKLPSIVSGDKLTGYNALANQILTVDYFTSGLSETSMRVGRSADGGTVGATYDFP